MTKTWGRLAATVLLSVLLVTAGLARGGGSFGGGRSGGSFGGGRSSFGGSSFGGGRSSGSFGGGSRSFGGSFGRSGSFGGSRGLGSHVSSYATRTPVSSRPYAYGGQAGNARYYGGWSDYSYRWGHPAWYMYTPFHPAFYYGAPVYYGGSYYPGQFDFLRLLIGVVLILAIVWLVVNIYKKVRA